MINGLLSRVIAAAHVTFDSAANQDGLENDESENSSSLFGYLGLSSSERLHRIRLLVSV